MGEATDGATGGATPPLASLPPQRPSAPPDEIAGPFADATDAEIGETIARTIIAATSEAFGGEIARTRGDVTGGAAYCEINRSAADLGAGTTAYRRWDVDFEDTTLVTRSVFHGSICLHEPSRWIMVRDEEDDILAGRYLQIHEYPKDGEALDIDGFHLVVRNPASPQKSNEQVTVCVDLTSNHIRFGGRFWVLADHEEDEDAEGMDRLQIEEPSLPRSNMAMPTAVIQERTIHSDFKVTKKTVVPSKGEFDDTG
ncbi:hypothetical protein ZWY2020_013201 [Hordeum vulgare]|nr:hypothetical protein ZWY2020_013201 [Hordeum vulgare]